MKDYIKKLYENGDLGPSTSTLSKAEQIEFLSQFNSDLRDLLSICKEWARRKAEKDASK